MEQSSGSQRFSWKNQELLKFFLEKCLEEVTQHGRQGSSLKQESWPRVGRAIETKFGKMPSQKQMKNEYDYMKDKYQAFVTLIGKTGNVVFDPATNSFNLTPEQWDEYLKGHPKAKPLRTNGMPFLDLSTSLYQGVAATGSRGWGPSSTTPRPGTGEVVLPSPPLLELPSTEQDGFGAENDDEAPSTPVDQGHSTNASNRTNASVQGERVNKKRKKVQPIDVDAKMDKVLDLIIEKHKQEHKQPSIAECTDKLERLGWDRTNPLYLAAVSIFGESQSYRDTWMMWRDDDRANMEGWIMLLGRKLGFM